MVIAIDFDGTITDDTPYPTTGKLRDRCKEALNNLSKAGHKLVLWTARKGEFYDEAVQFVKEHDLPLEIPPKFDGKIEADIYIDDRNPWETPINWDDIERGILMNRIENKENVSLIIMKPTACVKCQIGQDWYQCNFEVKFIPHESYPDYIEVQKFISDEIDGKEMNIEQATRILYEHLKRYDPSALEITNHVRGCKTHFDVDVTI